MSLTDETAERRPLSERITAIDWYHTLELAPGHVAGLLDLGVLLAGQEQVDEAIVYWEKVLAIEPDHPQAHHNLGVAMAQKGCPEDAKAHVAHRF